MDRQLSLYFVRSEVEQLVRKEWVNKVLDLKRPLFNEFNIDPKDMLREFQEGAGLWDETVYVACKEAK